MSTEPLITEHSLDLARRIARYHLLRHKLSAADVIIALGSNDPRVAERAAELFHEGLAQWIVFSGSYGALTKDLLRTTEAEHFSEIAVGCGVPAEAIILEDRATNTGENVIFSRKILEERGIFAARAIAVQKPYMERRTFATFAKLWPELEVLVTSPQISFEEYPLPWLPMYRVIEIMLGDLQRIRDYPAKGFQIEQEIPVDVLEAFQELSEMGFSGHLIERDQREPELEMAKAT